jgi:hypothetical protein
MRASVCLQDPGFGTDAFVTADTEALYRVYLGKLTLRQAMREGLVKVEGGPDIVRAFPGWFTWSDFAPVVRAGARRAATTAA